MYNTVTSCKCVIDIVLWLACTWFLKIDPVWIISMRVCVSSPPRLLITSGMIRTPYDWLNKFYRGYMAIVVVIINGRGLGIDTHRRH